MRNVLKSEIWSEVGYAGLIVVKVICCGALLLAMTGSLATVSAWFQEGSAAWLTLALAVIAGFSLHHVTRRGNRIRRPDRKPQIRKVRSPPPTPADSRFTGLHRSEVQHHPDTPVRAEGTDIDIRTP